MWHDDSNAFLDEVSERRKKPSSATCLTAASNGAVNVIRVSEKWEGAHFLTSLLQLLNSNSSSSSSSSTSSTYRLDWLSLDSPLKSNAATAANISSSSSSFSHGSDSGVDLELPGGLSVLILTESEYVGGCGLYKRRLAKLYSSRKAASVVVCVKSTQTPEEDFAAVQEFSVVELGLSLIPISDSLDRHLPTLLHQLVTVRQPSKKRRNPFKFGTKDKTNDNLAGPLDRAIATLETVPGLGEKKAKQLLEKFGSIMDISEASIALLTSVVGYSAASAVHRFFRLEKPKI